MLHEYTEPMQMWIATAANGISQRLNGTAGRGGAASAEEGILASVHGERPLMAKWVVVDAPEVNHVTAVGAQSRSAYARFYGSDVGKAVGRHFLLDLVKARFPKLGCI